MKNSPNLTDDERQYLDWFNDDSIGRNDELINFINYLNNSNDANSIFLDSGWGQGKTVFIKQAELLIRQKNEKLKDVGFELNYLDKLDSSSLFPVYYNAWENDNFDYPLASILASIEIQANVKFKSKIFVSFPKLASTIAEAALNCVGINASIQSLAGGIKWENYLDIYKNHVELNNRISEYLTTVSKKTQCKIILFVDELDRCKPNFALRLLETIKNNFNNKSIIIVYSVNCHELSNTVKKYYGNDMDGHMYLQKFYEKKFLLKDIDPNTYVELFKIGKSKDYLSHKIAVELSCALSLSLRQRNCYFKLIEEIDKIEIAARIQSSFIQYFKIGFLPLLIALKIAKPEYYESLLKDRSLSFIFNTVKTCTTLHSVFCQFGNSMYEYSNEESAPWDYVEIRLKDVFVYLSKHSSEEAWKKSVRELSESFIDFSPNIKNQFLQYL